MTPKTWFITGASSGFGYCLTELLLARGDHVFATSRRLGPLNELRERYRDSLQTAELDLVNSTAISEVVEMAFDCMGNVDVLVSNAGYVLLGAIEELEVEQIEQQLRTNLLGSILLIKAVLPHFRRRRHGRILQLSSEAGEIGLPALSIYQASKWGIEGFCESLRMEVSHFDIDVTIVVPGRAPTGLDNNAVAQNRIIGDYQRTTVGHYRRLLAMGKFPRIGSVEKMALAIIAAADAKKAPRRLFLGSDAYTEIHKALTERLSELEQQKESAAQTDAD